VGVKKIDLAYFGTVVADNVRRYRGETTYAELSRRLTELGRPIAPLGLRHIEADNRRVDVDDLVFLAVALDVAPLALLTPGAGHGYLAHEAYHLLIGGPRGWRASWRGRVPLKELLKPAARRPPQMRKEESVGDD
jgi:hypothetical protein